MLYCFGFLVLWDCSDAPSNLRFRALAFLAATAGRLADRDFASGFAGSVLPLATDLRWVVSLGAFLRTPDLLDLKPW